LIIAGPQIGRAAKDLAENAGSFVFSTRGSMTLLRAKVIITIIRNKEAFSS